MFKLYRDCLAATFILAGNLGAQAVSPAINDTASRVFGQTKLQLVSGAPNLVEGRELSGPQAIAFDTSVSPPIVYVSDTLNNRVLAWRNASSLSKGNPADLVIGQRKGDFNNTIAQGPGSANLLSSGLNTPGALAVDRQGNLYVCDTGNNRILRYPAPFKQSGDLLQVDLVIGQKTLNTGRSPNQGLAAPTAKTIALANNNGSFTTGLAFDPAGNLWATDPLNNRVLRYPLANLSPDTPEPAADVVLGQGSFTTNQGPVAPNAKQENKVNLSQPAALAFDPAGNLYVLDSFARVLYFLQPSQNLQPAVRVLGLNPTNAQGGAITPYPNNFTLGTANANGQLFPPSGIFMVGSNLFVCDTLSNRVVHYGLPADWAPETTNFFSPTLVGNALGQLDFVSGKANREKIEPDATTLALPVAGAALGNEIWIVDSANNRVLSFPQDALLTYNSANRVVGQVDFNFNQPNLVEGREVNFGGTGGGIAFDRNSNPPRLYIADFANHRILGFRDGRNVLPGAKADLVIGQPDMFHATINFPNGFAGPPSASSLYAPAGVAVDADGNLIVADTFNGRVLRFPSPFTQPAGTIRANLVLGQASFTSFSQDPSSQNMGQPWGVTLLADGSIAASDVLHNRVLIFRKPRNGDFTNFQRAEAVLGQNDFSSRTAGDGPAQLNQPRHMGVDTSDRLYVADALNNRVQIFVVGGSSIQPFGLARSATVPGLNRPQSVVVSPATGEAFIANSNSNQVLRIPEYQTVLLSGPTVTASLFSNGPVDLALDPFDNLVVAESVNRLAFFYARATYQHAATYNQFGIAPGQLTYLYRVGKDFNLTDKLIDGSQQSPWPTVLGDLQITVNGTPGRIFYVNSNRIDFQVPQNAPTSGNADFVVTRVSTGEIIAAASLPMVPTNPGFFTRSQTGSGQVAATDTTGKVNESTSPVKVNNYITLYLTGLGVVPNAPPDGMAPSGPTPAPGGTQVLINTTPIDLSKDPNAYSGLGAFPGGWQINVKVPGDVQCQGGPPICTAISILVIYNSVASNNGPNGSRLSTTITTAQ